MIYKTHWVWIHTRYESIPSDEMPIILDIRYQYLNIHNPSYSLKLWYSKPLYLNPTLAPSAISRYCYCTTSIISNIKFYIWRTPVISKRKSYFDPSEDWREGNIQYQIDTVSSTHITCNIKAVILTSCTILIRIQRLMYFNKKQIERTMQDNVKA